MTVQEAYLAGRNAYIEGGDIMNIPSHYSTTERELFILGYEEAEKIDDKFHERDLIDYYEGLDGGELEDLTDALYGSSEDSELDFDN